MEHPALRMPEPKGYRCPACGHETAIHREHGCDAYGCDGKTCECSLPYGRIMPKDGWPEVNASESNLADRQAMGYVQRADDLATQALSPAMAGEEQGDQRRELLVAAQVYATLAVAVANRRS